MARVTVEDCLDKVDNRFALVILSAKRARQLMRGAKPLVDHPKNKEAVLSLREIASGRVRFAQDVAEVLRREYSWDRKDAPTE